MKQAYDRANVKPAEFMKGSIGPVPICALVIERGNSFPKNRMTESLDSELCKALEVVETRAVSAAFQLLEIAIVDTVDCAFHAAPELESGAAPAFILNQENVS